MPKIKQQVPINRQERLPRKTPPGGSALALLLEIRMRAGTWPPFGRLPSVRELARSFAVSKKTANAALAHMVGAGIIEQSPDDKRYYVRGRKDWYPRTRAPGYRVTEIADTFRGEVMRSARIGPQTAVPSAKELQARFGCARETASKVLDLLCREALLVKRGRTYYRTESRAASQSCARIAVGRPLEALHDGHPIFSPILYGIESECRVSGWPTPVHFIPDEFSAAPGTVEKSNTGLIYIKGYGPWKSYLACQRLLPLVVIEVGELLGWIGQLQGRKNMFTICPDNVHAGLEMGKYLSGQGHERIAYFSHMAPSKGWWKLRMEGLTRIFSDSDNESSALRLLPFVLLSTAGAASERTDVTGSLPAVLDRAALLLDDLDAGLVRSALQPARKIVEVAEITAHMKPLFERALRDRSLTAWVCVNDQCAAAAIHFLRRYGDDRRVVVAGFDNSSISLQLQFPSFDFCYDQIGRMATQCIIRPEVFSGRRLGLLRVPGVVVDRRR